MYMAVKTYMKILTLNMNMFRYCLGSSFLNYLEDINPTIAIIQEFKIVHNEQHIINLPQNFSIIINQNNNEKEKNIKDIDKRIPLTVALISNSQKTSVLQSNTNTKKFVKIKIRNDENMISLTGVHIPLLNEGDGNTWGNNIGSPTIICGDFNASAKKQNSNNYKFLEKLKKDYTDLWCEAMEQQQAFYYNYKGEKINAQKDEFYRTYSGNTHIDYILGKKDKIKLQEIVIDTRTLSFTDHCAIIADIE